MYIITFLIADSRLYSAKIVLFKAKNLNNPIDTTKMIRVNRNKYINYELVVV